MAKKTTTAVVVTDTAKEVKTKKRKAIVRAPKREVPTDIEIDALPKRRVSDSGEVILTDISKSDLAYYRKISESLNERDMTSIMTYGSDLQKAMDGYSNDFLNQSFSSKTSMETAGLISDLLCELKKVDLKDLDEPSGFKRFLMSIPGVRTLVGKYEGIKVKYNTISQNIDGIVGKLEAKRQIALRDNNLLQRQFENNCEYVDQLEDLIVAGKLKSEELAEKLEEMRMNADQYNEHEIMDVDEYKNRLDKRITDLVVLRFAFKQSLSQIRIIQRTNLMDADNTQNQIMMTIPLWKNQLSQGVALHNQKNSMEASNKVFDTTNEILRKNSEMMKTQTVEIAKQAQRPIIDIETLKKTTADLYATIESVQKINEEGRQKRAQAEAEIRKLEEEVQKKSLGVAQSMQRVISRELRSASRERLLADSEVTVETID